MIKCCIFDLDGTILNTLTTITHFVNKTLQKFGYGSITTDECRRFVGNGARLLITRALASLGESDEPTISRVLADYDREYGSDPYHLTCTYEGIEDLLSDLRERGISLAVVSNKQDVITKAAVAHFFPSTFDVAVGGRDGIRLKPAPDAPLAVLAELGFDPSECAFIGDTSVDVQTGRNMSAGLVVGVSWGFRDASDLALADVIASSATDVLSAVFSVK